MNNKEVGAVKTKLFKALVLICLLVIALSCISYAVELQYDGTVLERANIMKSIEPGKSMNEIKEKVSLESDLTVEWIEVSGVEGGKIEFDSSTGTITDCETSVIKANIPSSINGVEVKKINDSAFDYCESLTSITIPSSVTEIGYGAFEGCTSLRSITIQSGVTFTGNSAFEGCTSLTSITIPSSVTKIGRYAFYHCKSLTSITIPSSVTFIGNSAFDGTKLKDVYYNGTKKQWDDIKIDSWNAPLLDATIHFGIGDELQSSYNKSGTDSNGKSVRVCVKDCRTLKTLDDAEMVMNGSHLSINLDKYETVSVENSTLKADDSRGTMELALVPKSLGTNISAVHCYNRDALVCDTKIMSNEASADIFVYSSLPANEISHYELLQNHYVIARSNDGHFIIAPNTITPYQRLSVRVVRTNGRNCNELMTNISIKDIIGKTPKLSTKCIFTIPNDVPVLGGGKIDIDLSVLPVVVQQDGNRVIIGIGAKQDLLKDGSSSQKWLNWKNFVTKQKESLRKGLNQYMVASAGDFWHPVSSGPDFKLDFEVYGFAEGLLKDDGQISQINGYIAIQIKGAVETQWQTVIVEVPIVIKLKASAGVASVQSVAMDVSSMDLYSSGTLDLTLPKVRLSAGVGIAHVADISVYGSLENRIEFKSSKPNTTDYIDASLIGEAGICATAFIFEADIPILDGTWTYYHWPTSKQSSKQGLLSGNSVMQEVLDEKSYSIDRSYLKSQSEWYPSGNSTRRILGSADNGAGNVGEGISVTTLQKSVYNSAGPQLVETDNGLKMLVWNADIESRSTGNHIAAVYSVLNESTGIWSEPKIIDDDGSTDGYITAAAYGDKIYLAWTDENRSDFTSEAEMSDFAAGCEISTAVYDEKTDTFDVQTLTSDSYADLKPVVYAGEKGICTAWIKNQSNDILKMSGINSVYYSAYSGQNGWSEAAEYASFEKPVNGLDIGILGSGITLAYSVDTDGEAGTVQDRDIYIGSPGGQQSRLTQNESAELNPQFAELNGDNILVWYQDGSIFVYNGDSVTEYTGGADSISSNFSIANNTLFSVIANDEGSRLYRSEFGEGCITGSSEISDNADYIASFSTLAGNDSTKVVYTKKIIDITESEVSESTDICVSEISNFHNLMLLEATADEYGCVPGGTVPVTLKIKNKGLYDENNIRVKASLEGEEKYNETLSVSIGKGDSEEVTIEIPLEDEVKAESKYEIEICTDSGSDRDSSDNKAEVTVGYPDLQLSSDLLRGGNITTAKLTVSNNGIVGSECGLNIYNQNGELLDYFYLDTIKPGDTEVFEIKSDMLPELSEPDITLSFEVISDCEEAAVGDNVTELYVSSAFELYAEPVASGSCGTKGHEEEVTWTLYDDNKLVISGDGAMADWSVLESDVVPWADYKEEISAVEIEDSVTSVGSFAFGGCDKIESIKIGKDVSSVGNLAFFGCTVLKSFDVDENNSHLSSENGVLFNKEKTVLVQYPAGKTDDSYTVPESVSEISNLAFCMNSSLKNVIITENVSRISDSAFEGCAYLEAITVSEDNADYSSADGVLFNKTGTELIKYPDGKSENSYTLPSTVTRVGAGAFRDNTSLTSVTLDENLTEIGEEAFGGCSGLTSMVIPAKVATIENRAFADCSNLKEVTFEGDAPTNFGENVFGTTSELASEFMIILPKNNSTWKSDEYDEINGTWNGYKIEISEIVYPVEINEKNFPDELFRQYISEYVDYDNDGSLSKSEIDDKTSMDFSGESITSIQGIEYFYNLQSLFCSNCDITEMDLSKHTKLGILRCENCNLTELDLSNNIYLTELVCGSDESTLSLTLPNTERTWMKDLPGFANNVSVVEGGTTIDVTSVSTIVSAYVTKVVLNNNLEDNPETKEYYCYGSLNTGDLLGAFSVPEGKVLAGWNTQADGSGESSSLSETYGVWGSEFTLYAQWNQNSDTGIILTDESDGGNLKIKASAFNNSGEDISASIIVAVYNSSGKQIAFKMVPLNVTEGSEGDASIQFDFKAQTGYTIKAYMIEAGEYTPLCEKAEL